MTDHWKPPEIQPDSPTALGVSIYAGGHSVGLARAGFNILAHFEEAEFGVPTFNANFPGVPVYLPHKYWPIEGYRGKANWVYSNSPCAPWSQVGTTMRKGRDGWKSDPRVMHTIHSFDMIDRLEPDVWSWESVQRTYTVGQEIVDYLSYELLGKGYAVTHLLTDGQLHGLPQRRARFFLIAHKYAIPWVEPSGTPPTVGQTLAGIEPDWHASMPQEWEAVVSVLKPGQYLRNRWEELNEFEEIPGQRVKGRPPYTIHRIRPDQVCSTITGMRSQLHWGENRYLANNELALLQGYPSNFQWVGPPSGVQDQLAKAVTPAVAEYLAARVAESLRLRIPAQPRVNVVDYRPLVGQRLAGLNKPLVR